MRFFTVILLGVFAISAFSPLPVSAEKLSRTVEFETPDIIDGFSRRGFLMLKKDNPSGLPEHDDALEIPIYFK